MTLVPVLKRPIQRTSIGTILFSSTSPAMTRDEVPCMKFKEALNFAKGGSRKRGVTGSTHVVGAALFLKEQQRARQLAIETLAGFGESSIGIESTFRIPIINFLPLLRWHLHIDQTEKCDL
jgi:hypothetical protein